MRKILFGTILAIAAIFITAGSGLGSGENKLISSLDAPKAQAEEIRGPAATLSPLQKEAISLKQDGLCYHKTTAGEFWYYPKKYGFDASDPVYELIAFEQEFDANGNAKYTDIVVPKEIDGIPVIDCNSFIDHYEIKSLRIKAAYSGWSEYSTQSDEEDIIFCHVCGCSNMEYYEMADDTEYLLQVNLMGCKSLKTIVIPKGMSMIESAAFKDCVNLQNIKFDKFTNLYDVGALRDLPWWMEKHTQKNGMVIYQKSLVDAGVKDSTIVIRRNRVKKVLADALENTQGSTIRVEDEVEWSEDAFDLCKAKKIIFGKKVSKIPIGEWYSGHTKKIYCMTKKKIKWGWKKDGKYQGIDWNANGIKRDLYIHSEKFHAASVSKWRNCKDLTVHVPRKVMAKYRKYTKCKVVAL